MPCLYVDVHLCLDMSMHFYSLSFANVCMSCLDVIVDLDVEIWLRPYKRYHWCRLTPEGHRGDGLR
jgi:hypothetical protein